MPLVPVNQAQSAPKVIAPGWLPGGHAQTIWPALRVRHSCPAALAAIRYERQRWPTPDGDFVDVDWLTLSPRPMQAPLLVLFHGLEGSSRSHYALAFARVAHDCGLNFAVPHFRGCSGQINLAPRAYHSGDFEEVGWLLSRLRQHTTRPLWVVGVSLGGNVLLRWAQEAGSQALQLASAVASVSAPLDLTASGQAMGLGFNRWVYTRMFLRSMKPKALQKLAQHPGLFQVQDLLKARTLYDFDNVFTAPLHGFQNTQDYWQRASALPHLHRLQLPSLLVNAQNDPFVPSASLPHAHQVSRHVTLWQPRQGGHVGFAQAPWPGQIQALPQAVVAWLAQQAHFNLKGCPNG
ncbi:alpha/beta fold hydrolase [Rhodoferax sp.]|uniref:YheT family hydrolase n=1 Tax=Rhodoferax sp. TaxID=50421 RepID=UPI00261F7F5D|nr:alpha/beta fold hydrolase [Rhodoferax sp.]MDD2810974.1 alpha/beta fold hydrolase [Rhodoferax sp.]